MQTNLDEKIRELDGLIRAGKAEQVRKALKRILRGKVQRRNSAPLATIARRVGLPMLGLRLLNPIMHPTRRKTTNPSPLEIAEYAVCLSYLGAETVALKLLDKYPVDPCPQILFSKLSALVAQWDYAKSIPVIKQYLELPEIENYQRLVGEANLAAALVYERYFEEAYPLIESLKQKTKDKHQFLFGKILDLDAQLSFYQKDFKTTLEKLNAAEKVLLDSKGIDSFFIKKWRAFVELLKAPENPTYLQQMDVVRNEAIKWAHWGAYRQCDYYEALATRNKDLLLKVYFGTPYESIRRHLLSDWGTLIEIPGLYLWQLGSGWATATTLKLFTGTSENTYPEIKPGQAPFALLQILTRDFYSPISATSLFFSLHPNNYFDHESSTRNIRQLLWRLRSTLDLHHSPLLIREELDQYRLVADEPCKIEIPFNRGHVDRLGMHIQKLVNRFNEESFSAVDAGLCLELSSSSALKLLQECMEKQLVEKSGHRKNSRYRFLKLLKKAG